MGERRERLADLGTQYLKATWPDAPESQFNEGLALLLEYMLAIEGREPDIAEQQAYADRLLEIFGPIKDAVITWGPNGHRHQRAPESPTDRPDARDIR